MFSLFPYRSVGSCSVKTPGLGRELERFVDDFLGGGEKTGFTPALDVTETPAGYLVEVELPGIAADKVTITFHEGVLTLQGEKTRTDLNDGEKLHRRERHFGSFQRSLRLGGRIDEEKIDASYKDGILTVTLPRLENDGKKTIEVKVQQ